MARRVKPSADLSVGAFAQRAGLAVSAVHYYESLGLIRSWRTDANHRRYDRAMLRRVAILKAATRLGVPLAEIGERLAVLPEGRIPTAADWRRVSAGWKEDLSARIARLEALRDQLDHCIGCGCLSVKSCPLHNPDDALGAEGSGPRRLDPDPDPQ